VFRLVVVVSRGKDFNAYLHLLLREANRRFVVELRGIGNSERTGRGSRSRYAGVISSPRGSFGNTLQLDGDVITGCAYVPVKQDLRRGLGTVAREGGVVAREVGSARTSAAPVRVGELLGSASEPYLELGDVCLL
jgi:hypothetical protein